MSRWLARFNERLLSATPAEHDHPRELPAALAKDETGPPAAIDAEAGIYETDADERAAIQGEESLPPPGTLERELSDARHHEMVAGLLRASRQRSLNPSKAPPGCAADHVA